MNNLLKTTALIISITVLPLFLYLYHQRANNDFIFENNLKCKSLGEKKEKLDWENNTDREGVSSQRCFFSPKVNSCLCESRGWYTDFTLPTEEYKGTEKHYSKLFDLVSKETLEHRTVGDGVWNAISRMEMVDSYK